MYEDMRFKPKAEDEILIRFKLDIPDSDLLECAAVVRNVGRKVGVEFVDNTERIKRILRIHFMDHQGVDR